MKILIKPLLILCFCCFNMQANSIPLETAIIIDKAQKAADKLVQAAFDRLDLTLLQAAMEARGTINEAAISLQNVITTTIDELDGQQRRVAKDLQDFERLVASDIKRALIEVREEKNSTISNLQLMLSDNPGAIRIIPKYALEGAQYVSYKILGVALSKAKFSNTKLNSVPTRFHIVSQSDTQIDIRVPINRSLTSRLLNNSRGKPAETRISFEFIEYSWFDLFETGKRVFSSTSYIMPKIIGTAKAVFSGILESKVTKVVTRSEQTEPVRSSNSYGGLKRYRGKTTRFFSFRPDHGWTIDTNKRIKHSFKRLNSGCSNTKSKGFIESKAKSFLKAKAIAVTDLGKGSVCTTKTTVSFTQMKTRREPKRLSPKIQKIMTNSDTKLQLSSNILRHFKGADLMHVEVSSPLFNNGTKFIKPNEELGGLKLDYDKPGRVAYLRLEH